MSALRLSLPALVFACAAASGCGPVRLPATEVDRDATFAAHRVHDGFLIDRLQDGGSGVIEPARWVNWHERFRVRSQDATLGDLRLTAPARVEVRESGATHTDAVEPAWEDGAIRLTLRRTTGAPLRLGPFERIGGSGYSVLSRNAPTLLDVQGTYRATILDADGHPVGWWQVHIAEPYQPRLFEGAVPGVSPAVGAGLSLALNSEIDWIENQTLDVYRGTSSGHFDGRSGSGR
jgi:hypothetical protein